MEITREEVEEYLADIKRAINLGRYQISARDKNRQLYLDYVISETQCKQVLLSLTADDFSEAVRNDHPKYSEEILYIFGKDVFLLPRFDGEKERVSGISLGKDRGENVMEKRDFCIECRKETEYVLKKVVCKKWIKDKEYDFEITVAVCAECGEEMNIPGLMDRNAQEIDEQYRRIENIVKVSDIEKLMEIYHIGKAPLSLALGFGEITITRYLSGQIPSKEYSDMIRRVLAYPKLMMKMLQENREKVGETAYKKSMKAAKELEVRFRVSDKLLHTISYIYERAGEVTPLALQKMLYYIQGIYMTIFDTPLYPEDCEAWVHGPVYEVVYNMFKNFKYNPIDDSCFVMIKDRYRELNVQEKYVIDMVIDSFGLYSGKTLEMITHKEKPWLDARGNYFPNEVCKEIITKDLMKDYFQSVAKSYDFHTVEGLKSYIRDKLMPEVLH